jgi:hypothetical protein
MSDLDKLIEAARAATAGRGPNDVEVGRLEGLGDAAAARLAARPGESATHHAGYLVGHLIRWLHERGKPLDAATLLTASVYGACIADEGGQQQLARPDRPMSTHTYAAIRTEKRIGAALDRADEQMLFGWLLEQAGGRATPQLLAKLDRIRARRLERTGLQRPAPTD